ncbi:tetratricopeptide repeat protein [Jejudonia soesokkakensis]|uniref:Tetratricopeptide repeat protein n=1 Tax=Jejudonia soesokkakensis TaxID=1323432 RepID=A0ABW2MMD7_9FLAO
MKKVLVYILLCVVSISIAQNNALFDQGKAAYKSERYQDAINAWMKVLDNEQHSASLYFNLGNAHYKMNHVGLSVYYYEKALQLSPNDADIKTNLAFAQNARIDAIEPLPKTIFAKWNASVLQLFTFEGWALLSVILVSTFVLLFLGYYFSASERNKRMLFISSILSVIMGIAALTMAFKTYSDVTSNNPAIVLAEISEVKSGPSLGSDNAFTLHEGTKVQILDTEDDWLRIKLADGKEGWLPANDVKQL